MQPQIWLHTSTENKIGTLWSEVPNLHSCTTVVTVCMLRYLLELHNIDSFCEEPGPHCAGWWAAHLIWSFRSRSNYSQFTFDFVQSHGEDHHHHMPNFPPGSFANFYQRQLGYTIESFPPPLVCSGCVDIWVFIELFKLNSNQKVRVACAAKSVKMLLL